MSDSYLPIILTYFFNKLLNLSIVFFIAINTTKQSRQHKKDSLFITIKTYNSDNKIDKITSYLVIRQIRRFRYLLRKKADLRVS